MKNFTKKLSAIALCTVFASMQVGFAAGLSDASINHVEGGFKDSIAGDKTLDLNFNGNAHVNWDKLNVNHGETLNFNAVDGANGLTILNTVNKGMTNIYGTVNSNEGISKLIISNPNGMLFDGATFTTAGDLMLTTQALGAEFVGNAMNIKALEQAAVNGITIQDNSNFNVGGSFNIAAPSIEIIESAIKAGDVKLVTRDGQNYLALPSDKTTIKKSGVKMQTVSIDGNVYVLSGKDIVKVVNGGKINGDLTIDSNGVVSINVVNDAKNAFEVTGDLTAKSDGDLNLFIKDEQTGKYKEQGNFMMVRNTKVGGNIDMSNSGGFLEVANVKAGGNVNLTTTEGANSHLRHYVHVVGSNAVEGDLKVNALDNIHIGGYDDALTGLTKGSLDVKGNIDATSKNGTIAVTVNTSADKISLNSESLNVISDTKSVIKANEYQFKAKHYVGGVGSNQKIIKVMEEYAPLDSVKQGAYMTIDGGKITKLETGKAYIKSNNDVNVDGIKAKEVYLTADQADIKIEKDNHADLITVGGETKNLTVELPSNSRDYTLKYTNIKDTEVITINPETEITYEMANGDKGWNKGTQTKDNTYLVVPGEGPVDPVNPPINPEDNDNVKILNNLQRDQINAAIDANEVYTPVAFAADLDDEIDTGVRKNVDGSVTVVRPYTPVN